MKLVRIIFFMVVCVVTLLLIPGNSVFASGQEMPVLRLGDANDAVYTLQRELEKRGFYQSAVDGKFGSYTKAAVVEFQQVTGIEDDGIVGLGTWQALRNFAGTAEASRGNFNGKLGQKIVNFAQGFLGVPYAWGGAAPGGFDCSGFVYYVYSQYGISLPRVADEQYNFGRRVSLNDIQPGDLVFYSTYTPGPSHVGIYVGNGQFIHASSGAGEVTVTAMSKPYYQTRFLGAFRIAR
ncbi:MAG: spore cortex-lytic enzyme [Firmicutes bacterium]|nr:spore cortex-lytic enzyme [Bacillota bacterium]